MLTIEEKIKHMSQKDAMEYIYMLYVEEKSMEKKIYLFQLYNSLSRCER